MLYSIAHFVFGVMNNFKPWIGPLFLLYQFGQLAFNVRFFIHDMSLRRGNNIIHTLRKISEFAIGSYITR